MYIQNKSSLINNGCFIIAVLSIYGIVRFRSSQGNKSSSAVTKDVRHISLPLEQIPYTDIQCATRLWLQHCD